MATVEIKHERTLIERIRRACWRAVYRALGAALWRLETACGIVAGWRARINDALDPRPNVSCPIWRDEYTGWITAAYGDDYVVFRTDDRGMTWFRDDEDDRPAIVP